ncbi:MAG: DUF350 domain-containing protein [Gammaproteobacteria bacterium]|jgi:uncharacterized membrane protein YjfL (UPF0719 family)|nr:DUF350 domain-containing protein [Gammaproteobacteria bacterium]MBT7308001.1 DUF350 domain-containing protein [Gammaproteobacteria bacterium]
MIMIDTLHPILLNLIYVMIGGVLTLLFMWVGCRMFAHIMDFSISEELQKGNQAVGQMIMGLYIGIGVALGLAIGLGLN